jgi:LytS/YehU family sensor histidine kinase
VVPAVLLIFFYFILYSLGLYFWRFIGIQAHIYSEIAKYPSIEEGVTNILPMSVSAVVFFAIIIHIYDYQKLKKVTQQLRIEKQEAELNYLKSQTNPHFLFNTLNNIYSLTLSKSDLAPESVMRLSKILRYMLYDASGEYISIDQEIKVINDYIALEQLRYDDTLHVNFAHNIEDAKQSMPPLLLIPLVENAFKHGVAETRTNPFVNIHLSVQNRRLNFTIKNSSENTTGDEVKESIGLSNLRRQLELLYKEFELLARYEANTFTAILKINLASHV